MHPCHPFLTNRYALHNVDSNYMRRISGFPLLERMKGMCSELRFEMPETICLPCPIPPWQMNRCEFTRLTQEKRCDIDIVRLKCEFLDFKLCYPAYAFLYTDGSKTVHGVGCSFVHGAHICRYKLPAFCSIFTAEAVAILHALEYIKQQGLRKCVICTDSLSVTTALQNSDSDHPTIVHILETMHHLIASGHIITLAWIPGHCSITGNEAADVQAKMAVETGNVCTVRFGYQEYVPVLKSAVRDLFNKLWVEYRPGTALKAIKSVTGKWETSSRPNRREEIILCRLRLGHTRLTHSYIMDRESRPICDRCQCPCTVQHLLIECLKYANERVPLYVACQRHGVPLSLKTIIGNEYVDNIDEMFAFLQRCQLLKLL